MDDREQPEDAEQPFARSSDPEIPFADQVPMARPIQGAVVYSAATDAPRVGGSWVRTDEFLLTGASRQSVWIDIGLAIILLIVIQAAAIGILWLVLGESAFVRPDAAIEGADEATATPRGSLIPMLALQAVSAIVVVAGILRYRRQTPASVGVAWASLPLNGLIGLGAMAVCYALIFPTMFGLFAVFPGMQEQMDENAVRLMALIPYMAPWKFAIIATLVGTWEELMFRGFLMTRLRRGTGSWIVAVLISTMVFTALHASEQTLPALIMISILSIVMSLVTIWRRSIIPAIVGHALFDFTQFIGLYMYSPAEAWM
ncbi:MAG: CPBP family intramembrane metalloprotease [Planctomycetes bacterium]|nr:CPBP family intramembrane metalloprotease [Planctomycetota bacterium]